MSCVHSGACLGPAQDAVITHVVCAVGFGEGWVGAFAFEFVQGEGGSAGLWHCVRGTRCACAVAYFQPFLAVSGGGIGLGEWALMRAQVATMRVTRHGMCWKQHCTDPVH